MERKKESISKGNLAQLQRIGDLLSRSNLSSRMGWQYGSDRKIYKALGYPEEKDLNFQYYYDKYERQDIATAIIDRPVNATWNGSINIVESNSNAKDSKLAAAWRELNNTHKIKSRLIKLDKLTGIGRYGILLFGFDDVKETKDFKNPVSGRRKLLYLKQYSENDISIHEKENNSSNDRYGLPKFYKLQIEGGNRNELTKEVIIHHSRILHVLSNNITSEIYGRPRLKPIVNRLNDLEKLLGGDAEMFWRGARPGYHAAAQSDYEMGTEEVKALEDELDKYEHDLRRFISAKGVDIKPLQQQVADPLNHIDAQLQAISAETGIPKRVLVGSERGELASSQDKDQWLNLINSRMIDFAEPVILRPLIDKLMSVGVLPKVKEYVIIWEDIFAPSEKQKAEVGKQRADALKVYAESPYAADILPPQLAYKFLLGLSEDQVNEIMEEVDLAAIEEDKMLKIETQPQISSQN